MNDWEKIPYLPEYGSMDIKTIQGSFTNMIEFEHLVAKEVERCMAWQWKWLEQIDE